MILKIHYSAAYGKKAMFAQYVVANNEDIFIRQVFFIEEKN